MAKSKAVATRDDTPVLGWEPPTSDQEFEFNQAGQVPEWGSKGWLSWDNGPSLAIPMGDLWGKGPYHTADAHIGDTVRFVAATASKGAHFVIIEGEPSEDEGTQLPPAVTNASLEDLIKGGMLAPGDLGSEARGQVIARSPELRRMLEA